MGLCSNSIGLLLQLHWFLFCLVFYHLLFCSARVRNKNTSTCFVGMNQAGLAECIVRAVQACHPYIQPVLYERYCWLLIHSGPILIFDSIVWPVFSCVGLFPALSWQVEARCSLDLLKDCKSFIFITRDGFIACCTTESTHILSFESAGKENFGLLCLRTTMWR